MRGFRVDKQYICSPCQNDLSEYDWLYLGFMAILPLIIHWFCIDLNRQNQRKFTKGEMILHASACIEVLLSAFLTILFTDPVWELRINSCGVRVLSDWYTLFHNPTPNYETTLYCTQEAVYPLQTMIFVFYLFCVTFMMIIRPVLNARALPVCGKMAVYYALYIFPILSLLHAVAGGLICMYILYPCLYQYCFCSHESVFFRLPVPLSQHCNLGGIECIAFLVQTGPDDEVFAGKFSHTDAQCDYYS